MTGRAHKVAQNEGGVGARLLPIIGGIISTLGMSGKIVAAACLMVMFGALLVNVILRYFFRSGLIWAYEIHSILLPWLIAGGMVVAAALGRHIVINLLPSLLNDAQRKVLFIAINFSVALVSIIILWTGLPILRASRFQTIPALGVTHFWGYLSLYYAFSGIAVISICDMARLALGYRAEEPDLENSSLS